MRGMCTAGYGRHLFYKADGMKNWFGQAVQFLREAYAELTKVTWLSRKEAVASTIVVVMLVIVLAIFVGFTDFVLSRVLGIFF